MASLAVRDHFADNLLTPGNSALLIINDQPVQAIREGFEVCPVGDAVGGTSVESHRAGLGSTSAIRWSPRAAKPRSDAKGRARR